MTRAMVILLLAGCATTPEAPEPAAPVDDRCAIPLVTVSSTDLLAPATLASIRRTNAEIRTQCRSP